MTVFVQSCRLAVLLYTWHSLCLCNIFTLLVLAHTNMVNTKVE